MQTTIDGAGRIIVPKRFRDLLGLSGGQRIEIELDGTGLRLAAVAADTELLEEDGVTVAGPAGPVGPPVAWSPEEERALLEAVRGRA